MKTYISPLLTLMALFSFTTASGQQSLPELRAEALSKVTAYKLRHPAKEAPKNPLYGSYAWELEEALELALSMHAHSAEESHLMLSQILKAALVRLDLSFDPKKVKKSRPPELPKEFKQGNNPVIDPSRIKDHTAREDYEKRLSEYRAPLEIASEQTRLRYLVFTIVRQFEIMLPKEPLELRQQIQGSLSKELQGIKLPAEDQERLKKALNSKRPK